MSENLSEEQVKEALESGYAQSEALLNDKDELDDFLYRLDTESLRFHESHLLELSPVVLRVLDIASHL